MSPGLIVSHAGNGYNIGSMPARSAAFAIVRNLRSMQNGSDAVTVIRLAKQVALYGSIPLLYEAPPHSMTPVECMLRTEASTISI
jgi:hypothetical protein